MEEEFYAGKERPVGTRVETISERRGPAPARLAQEGQRATGVRPFLSLFTHRRYHQSKL